MSNVVLSASVRQNLLSLQSTADLLATTQNRLASGKKVNTALDNPTNFFTAAGLDSRSSDINNLLDGISNGVQIIQAANTGITSIQKLLDNAKSVANQALQTTVGYSPKSNVTSAVIPGATADNLLGAYGNTAATIGTQLYIAPAGTNAGPATKLSDLTTALGAANAIAAGETITINGKTITFQAGSAALAGTGTSYTMGIGNSLSTLVEALDNLQGNTAIPSTVTTGQIQLNTGTSADLVLGGTALAKLGLTAGTTARVAPPVEGLQLTIPVTSSAGVTTTSLITFGNAPGQVKSLNDLNSKLAANNLQAVIDYSGKINITTTNDMASATIGTLTYVGGNSTAFQGLAGLPPVVDPVAQATRANLVYQYNTITSQIDKTAQDASFNGVNLLNGDTLKLVFNETGRSTLTVTGTSLTAASIGLPALVVGVDFLDNAGANKVLNSLTAASGQLRSQASTLGANLSIVQIRQDFAKNLINVLQTGSSNLTLADTNEEAANSQALSTRQSIAVSALSLANQSQQSVLQLLR